MESLKQILSNRPANKISYSKHEFQDFGYRLAEQLNDFEHKSLYIKLARDSERNLLLDALDFVKGAHAKKPARLFMWKLRDLREQSKSKPKS